ncbi:MAG: transcription-repair coupling factor, partial [Burkholderiaceae bacterium]|nr:transcription-repair coupling factor [Burkholderiaceae bacterium]
MSDFSLSALPAVKPGSRFVFSGLQGAADALLLARYLEQHRAAVPMLAVVCANAVDAQRLAEELRWFAPQARVKLLPDWETLPYDSFSPHQDLISERLATLHDLQNGACDILLVPASTALQRVAPPSFLAAYTFFFKKGEKLDEAALKAQFTLAGYEHVSAVMRPGEYSVRGGLIDLFPMGSPLPYRLDLFGDEIETIRSFDPDTQRSLYPVNEVRLLPGREFPMDEASRTAFRGRWREVFEGDPTRSPIYKDIGNGVPSAGIEYYLPLFFEETATLFDYLPGATHLAFVGDIEGAVRRFWADTTQRYNFMRHDRERPLLQPSALYLDEEAFFVAAKPHARLVLRAEPGDAPLSLPLPNVAVNRRAEDPLVNLESFLMRSNCRVMICAESAGRRETLAQMLAASGLHPEGVADFADLMSGDAKFVLGVAPLYQGFILGDERIALITETELYAQTVRRAG